MIQTPSLANPSVLTTPPGTRFLASLHVILSNTSQYTSMSTATSTVLRVLTNHIQQKTIWRHVKIPPIVNSYWPAQTLLSASLVSHNSTVLTWSDSRFSTVSNSGFPDSIRIKGFNGIQLRIYQFDQTQDFWLGSTLHLRLDLTHCFWQDSTQFSVWFDSTHA